MTEVLEFKDVFALNKYLAENRLKSEFEIVPVSKMFENPTNNRLMNTITYVLIIN